MSAEQDFTMQMVTGDGGTEPNPIILELSVTTPSNGATFTGNSPTVTATFSGSVLAERVTLQGVRVRVGSGAWVNAQGTTNWTYTHSFTSPGPYQFTIEAYGVTALGSAITSTQNRDVTVNINDVTAPSLTIISPANNSSISGNGLVASITVRIQALDSLSGVKRIRWTLDGVAQSDNMYDTPVKTQVDLSRTFEIPARANPAHTIVISAVDDKNNTATAPTFNFTDVDNTAPFLTITSPQPNTKILGTPSGAVVTVRGTAEDRQSGTAMVELSLDGASFSPATSSNNWADWQGTVTFPAMAYKGYTITVRTRDVRNNSRTETIPVEMVRPFKATNAAELLSPRAFLEDLLIFANNIVSTSANPNDRITGAQLQQAFYQPFDRLTDTLTTTGSEPVNQVRVAVEVLRRYLPVAHWPFNEGSGSTLADAMSADNVGTLLDTTTWRLGRIRHSLFFDSVGDAVNIASTPNSRLRNLVNTFTVAFWAYPVATHINNEVQSNTGIAGNNQRYAIVPQQGGVVYGSSDHAGMGVSVGTNGVTVYEHSDYYRPPLLVHSATLSGWTHVAIVYKDRQPSLYINGVLAKTGLQSTKLNVHACPEAFGGGSFGRYYGFLDDIRIYDRVLSTNEIAALATMYNEWVWIEDALPVGAILPSTDTVTEAWNWISSNPPPLSGLKANTSSVHAGVHQQYFTGATARMAIDTGDTLYAYMYLDPQSPPTEVMFQFNDGQWEHRAYWGANSIEWGVNDSPARCYVGPLPPTGQWVRLEVPASDLALEGREVNGFALTLFNGRASLDRVGKLKAGVAAAFADNFVLPPVEALYRETVYQALLTRIGTSYTELRLARSADTSTRQTLADRLGILLDNDQLTILRLVGSAITEKKLEELFGLADTSRDPLTASQESWLLREQRRYLSALWLRQDTETGHDGAPIIDPDLITHDDLASVATGNAAHDLYEERCTWLATTFGNFPTYSAIQSAQKTPFETHLKNTLLAVTQGNPEWTDATAVSKFLELESALGQGTNIDTTLELLGLDIVAFRTLVRAHSLVADNSNSLLESEWLDVRQILTQMLKRKQYSAWRQAEQQRQITLSGQFFKWSPVTPQLLPWRASVQAREAWQETLRIRIEQDRAVENALKANVAAAEEIALPILREALVQAIGAYQGVPDTAEWLYRRLLVDFKTGGSQRTTRVLQAIETLQGVLFALRAGQFDETHPADAWQLIVDETAFDQEWRWMSSHEAWRAAMLMFFFPENLLQPNLREPVTQTSAYRLMIKDLRAGQRLTPDLARVTASDFLNRCRASANLEKPGAAPNLAAHWRLDEGVGTALTDASVDAPAPGQAATAYGATWIGSALRFDGRDDYVEVNNPTTLAMVNQITITAWIYPEGPGSDGVGGGLILNQEPEYKVGRLPDGTIRYSFFKINPDWGWVVTTYKAPVNQWTHIAVVYNNGIVKTYANGQLKHTYTGTVSAGALALQRVRIGGHSSQSVYFHGFMRDVRVYRAALNQIEVGLLAVPLTDQLNEAQLTDLGGLSQAVMQIYRTSPPAAPSLELWREIFFYAPMTLGLWLQQAGEYLTALDWYQTVYAYNLPMNTRKLYNALTVEQNIAPVLTRGARWLQTINPHTLVDGRSGNPYTRYILMTIARCFLEFADSEFTRDTGESIAKARSLYNMARSLLQLDELQSPRVTDPQAFTLPNPVLEALRLRADSQLAKLRQGRNIAGMKRQVEIYTPPPTTVNMLPTVGSGGQLVMAGAAPQFRPTPYRFNVLLERSKQLVGLAQQMEGAYLAALEKRDAENYNLLKAGQELKVADLTVDLQTLRVEEADKSITLAQKQESRAQSLEKKYTDLINGGFNQWEEAMIDGYEKTRKIKNKMAMLDYMITSAQAMIDAASANPVSAGLAFVSAAVTTYGAFERTGLTSDLNGVEERLAVAGIQASHERRVEEWTLSQEMAIIDKDIATQQVLIAEDQKSIVEKEQQISQANALNARAVADFLANKFTSAELYEWMSGVLAGVYNYFLQQATAMAQLAENQLKFERQQASPGFIQADYWRVSAEDGSNTDRRGLTGSARLLQDIYQLDQYAFEKDKRKLNLSQTFSLAHLMPLEFQQFRETGTLAFSTPMRLFDEVFPGHYLRLIKRVRTTVIALVPPTQGIRATLRTSGYSDVVVGGDIFQTAHITRDSEMVALTSPNSATGVFEMDAQADMLLPFESMGVATEWVFQMPRAANPFNFDSIADVLITIEYTALNDDNYRSQVIQSLNRRVSANRTFSLHDHFPDEWYALNNPDPDGAAPVVRFTLGRSYFPPNVDGLKVEHLMLYVAGLAQHPLTSPLVIHMHLLSGSNSSDGVAATIAPNGVADSRGSSPGAWSGIIGRSPVSEWELSLPSTTEVQDLFRNGYIKDIVINITYEGVLPEWPA